MRVIRRLPTTTSALSVLASGALALGTLASPAAAQTFHPGPKIGPPTAADLAGGAQPPVVPTFDGPCAFAGPRLPICEAVRSSDRPAADRARDGARHPEATLSFWGLAPGMTVVDLQPGGGYWTRILAPYVTQTHGRYLAGGSAQGRAAFLAKFAGKAGYGDVGYVEFGKGAPAFAPPGSVDLVISSREIHNWMGGGYEAQAMAQVAAALKPGGVFAVEEHRADGSRAPADGSSGYVRTSDVVAAAEAAGLKLDGASEVNANPKDTKDHPFGVWTLPPSRQSAPDGKPADPAFDHAKYDAIGESDRMTLRFRKPA